MKAVIISSNNKRKTAMITVVYGDGSRKRSETRHCKQTSSGMIGGMLDQHRDALRKMQEISTLWAHKIDSLNAELGNKAKRAIPYNANLYFAWAEGDNSVAYQKHLNGERDRASHIGDVLWEEGARLEALAEIRRAEKRVKLEKKINLAVAPT